jgi:dTMP kinase
MLIRTPFSLTNPANLFDWPAPRFGSFMLVNAEPELAQDTNEVVRRAYVKVNQSLSAGAWEGLPKSRGLFIAIEGADGVGKSTLVSQLCRDWHGMVHPDKALATCEPTRGEFGMMARSMLSKVNSESSSRLHQVLTILFVADRLEHLEQEVYPALRSGKTVITDRYALSQVVYQTTLMGMPIDEVREAEGLLPILHRACPMPDLTVWMDAPDEVLDDRIRRRGNAESVELGETARKVRQRYRELLAQPFNTDGGMSAPIIDRCAKQFVVFGPNDKPEKIYHAARLLLLARLQAQRG